MLSSLDFLPFIRERVFRGEMGFNASDTAAINSLCRREGREDCERLGSWRLEKKCRNPTIR